MNSYEPEEFSRTDHSHPAPLPGQEKRPIVVVGGGHAGVEAALAAVRLGHPCVLVSHRLDLLGEMSCNPAIGGLGKGQIVREVDALGGLMGHVADATGIQFRMLGTRKGRAVQALRCQSDRHAYRELVVATLRATAGLELVEDDVQELVLEEDRHAPRKLRVTGVELTSGRRLDAVAVVLTTGTFLRAVMHVGENVTEGGRVGEAAATGLARSIERIGLELGRLKTGTPPRLSAASIDFEGLDEQWGDPAPRPFSFQTAEESFPRLEQICCHSTWTNERTHDLIRANIHRAPMYSGQINGVGPRYCPAVEDKIMRFADKDRHQVILEREALCSDVVYANGISTSLPGDVQEAFARTIKGLEHVRFVRPGYAVEYDFVHPRQLDDTLAVRALPGLYLAGQINGTSGYEEAACQGLVAGANAALWAAQRAPFVLARHEAYTGVLVDDLVSSNPQEPYRMFSSRAEYRLLLRQDDADRRLTPRGFEVGLVDEERRAQAQARTDSIAAAAELLRTRRSAEYSHQTLAEVLRRPEMTLENLFEEAPELAELSLDVRETLEADIKYAGYVARQKKDVERLRRQEHTLIPLSIDYSRLRGLSGEAAEKLESLAPRTLGVAGRIPGVRPPDVALLAVHVERLRREALE